MKKTRAKTGWMLYDFANSAFATSVLAVIFNRYFAAEVAGGETGIPFQFLWFTVQIPGSALWSFIVAFSTALVAISAPVLGAIADRGRLRKRFFLVYCYIGVLCTMALSVIGKGDILLGASVFIIANLGFAGGNVFYNSFLLDVSEPGDFGRISGTAWGLGYLGGGLCLILNLIMLMKPQLIGFPDGHFSVGDCMVVAGLWWGIFALPTMLWLKEKDVSTKRERLTELTVEAWRGLIETVRHIRRHNQLVRFLIAYLIFNDGIQTVIIMASIFGAEIVGMDAGELVGYFIIIQGSAFIGSFIFGWLADKIGNKQALMVSLAVWLSVVLWAFRIGWLVDVRTDYYIIGILAGLVLGGSQATARAMQASFTPNERASEFFGFYAVSGKFASIFGPLVYGGAILLTGGVQTGILALGIFFLIGGVILWTVDEKAGSASS